MKRENEKIRYENFCENAEVDEIFDHAGGGMSAKIKNEGDFEIVELTANGLCTKDGRVYSPFHSAYYDDLINPIFENDLLSMADYEAMRTEIKRLHEICREQSTELAELKNKLIKGNSPVVVDIFHDCFNPKDAAEFIQYAKAIVGMRNIFRVLDNGGECLFSITQIAWFMNQVVNYLTTFAEKAEREN